MAFPIQNLFTNTQTLPTFGQNFSSIPQTTLSAQPQIQPQQFMGLLQAIFGALTQLSQAWGGFGGQQQQPGQYNPGLGQQYMNQAYQYGAGTATPSGYVPNTGTGGTTGTGGGYGGTGTGTVNPANYSSLPPSPDPQDFASYLQAQLAGGTLSGGTSISQADAIPGSRFALVQSPQLWHANVARNYAYQFAAFASGNDALTPQGMQAGAQAFHQMSPESRLFMQVASVFKGNMMGGPGFYDNAGLQKLLQSKGINDLSGLGGVGQTDVQTIGAVAQAINRGQLSLNDVINSGTISDMDRYFQVINYVQNGQFALDTQAYDQVRI